MATVERNAIFAEIAGLNGKWQKIIDTLETDTLLTNEPLRLTLVGAFSVGKSSLLNMLLGEPLLQTAMDESTALPTFIEYGVQRSMQLLGTDGSILPLDEQGFATATTRAPTGAACAVLSLPLEWLRDISIIDLPGLGSLSAAHREYTLAQIQQADAVLYLISPRGPAQSDLEVLQQIRQSGKRVKVLVSRWDEVEAAILRGEKKPSLEQWAAQIETSTGLRVRLAPVSIQGVGRDEVLDFLQRAKTDLTEIRQRRFCAELKPVLENALGQNEAAQRSCEVRSEEAIRTLHNELMQHKQALVDLKVNLYEQQQQERTRLEQECTRTIQQQRASLMQMLKTQVEELTEESAWNDFTHQGTSQLHTSLSTLAAVLSELSSNYGELQLPEAQVAELNLRLPPAEAVEATDFLDVGKLAQLQHQLEIYQAEFAAAEQKLANLPVTGLNEEGQALQELLFQRQQVTMQPLPRIVQRVSDGGGAAIGRMLGEIADIGLMFVNPAAVGTKVAAVLGKGAKVARTVSRGIKVAQGVQLGRRVPGVPQQALDKLGVLEAISLGYWGERIGTMIGGGSHDKEIIDPEARLAQQQALAEIDLKANTLRRELARNEDIANERQLTGWALEQNRKEQTRLQTELALISKQAEQKHREAQETLHEERQMLLARHAERAMSQWLRSFDQQTTGMLDLLRARVKSHWEGRIETMVGERLLEVDDLSQKINATPLAKEQELACLHQEASVIQQALRNLS